MTKVPFGDVKLGDLARSIGEAFHASHDRMSQELIARSVQINLQKSKYDLTTMVKDVGVKDMKQFNAHYTNFMGARCAYGFQHLEQDGKTTATTYVVLVGGGMGGIGGVEGVDQGKSPAIKIFKPAFAPLEDSRPADKVRRGKSGRFSFGTSPSA